MRTPAALALVLCLASSALAAPAPKKGAAVPATPELAKTLVEAVRVAAEDVVLVRSNAESLALAELVVAEVSRRGATAVFDFRPAAVVRAVVNELPEAYLERLSTYEAAQTQLVNAIIELGPSDDPALDAGVDAMRLIRARRGRHAAAEKLYGTEIRRVVLGGASFPGDDAAKLFKGDAGALSRSFWDAVAVKTPIVEDRIARVTKAMSGLKVVKVTTANGTDLELRLAARPIYANAGFLSEEVLQRPGVKEASLPAGGVATVPTEFFASGSLVVDAFEHNGVIVKDLKLSFREGKATIESGGENFDAFKKSFNLASGDKAVIALFSVGTNDASKPAPGSFYRSPEMAGVVTIGIGWNRDVGGFNNTSFQARFKLVNATVKIDDQLVVENGALKLK